MDIIVYVCDWFTVLFSIAIVTKPRCFPQVTSLHSHSVEMTYDLTHYHTQKIQVTNNGNKCNHLLPPLRPDLP